MTVTVGETCTLECKVAGTPELSVEWYKDGKLLTSSQKHKFSFYNKMSSLKILSVEKEDAGTYTFQVQNNVGKSSCTAVVDVSGQFGRFLQLANAAFSYELSFFLFSCLESPQIICLSSRRPNGSSLFHTKTEGYWWGPGHFLHLRM